MGCIVQIPNVGSQIVLVKGKEGVVLRDTLIAM
jgi:hypothetical protein